MNFEQLERLRNKRIRVCQTLHDCCLCGLPIRHGDIYYDGGYGKRAHDTCLLDNWKRAKREQQ